jgi:hypothetical protein
MSASVATPSPNMPAHARFAMSTPIVSTPTVTAMPSASAIKVTPNPISMTIIAASSSAEGRSRPHSRGSRQATMVDATAARPPGAIPMRARQSNTPANRCKCVLFLGVALEFTNFLRGVAKNDEGRPGRRAKVGTAVSVPRCPSGQCVGTRRPLTRQRWRHVPLCRQPRRLPFSLDPFLDRWLLVAMRHVVCP